VLLKHAQANNARLRKVFPKGFALDAAHQPNTTMLQCFVRTADLDSVYAAAGRVLAGANVNAMKLEAFKFSYAPGGAVGVAGTGDRPTAESIKLQADSIAAVRPFMVETAPIGALTAPHEEAATDPAIIQLRVDVCAENDRRELQPPRQHWRRPSRLPRQAARRTD
jgi:hypothetical protein